MDADLATIVPDALARETLALPNSVAWATMQTRLAKLKIRHVGPVRDQAWRIRRQLQAAQGREAVTTPSR
jgi:hypothetical protein